MKLESNAKSKLDQFMSTYYSNGSFHFTEEQLSYDQSDIEYQEIYQIVCDYRMAGFQAVDAMIQVTRIIYAFLYNSVSYAFENECEHRLYSLLCSLNHPTEEQLLCLAASSNHEGYSDLLDYEMDEETEMQYLWRY